MKIKKIFMFILAAVLTFNVFIVPAQAFATENTNVSRVDGLYERELKDIENEVRFIFEKASQWENGKLTINEDLLKQAYGDKLGAYVALGIEELYTNENLPAQILAISYEKSFWSCMKDELIGLIPGVDIYQLLTSGDLKAYIEGKAWGKVAEILRKQLVKFGLKSNVAGIIGSIAIGAGKCAIWG